MTINVNGQSIITDTIGTRTHHCCKPVINKTTGDVYASAIDAAETLGCSVELVSSCCRGKLKTCKGYKLEYVKHASENVDSLTAQIRALNAKIAELEADAAIGRAIRKLEEEARKAEEERLNEIAATELAIEKEKKRLAHREEIIKRKEEEYYEAISRRDATETKIHELEMHLLQLKGDVKA